jgi:hypothetical protein
MLVSQHHARFTRPVFRDRFSRLETEELLNAELSPARHLNDGCSGNAAIVGASFGA